MATYKCEVRCVVCSKITAAVDRVPEENRPWYTRMIYAQKPVCSEHPNVKHFRDAFHIFWLPDGRPGLGL